MLRILQAMLWEQWRISRLELLFRVSLMFLILGLFALVGKHDDASTTVVLQGILVFILGFAALFSASWTQDLDSRQLGFTYSLGFTRPITTRALVFVPIMYSLVLSQLFYLGSAVSMNRLLGLSIPLAGPAAIIACTVCLLIAGAWSSSRIDGRIAGMIGAMSITITWLSIRNFLLEHGEPVLVAIGREGYFALTWYEYLGLASVAGLAVAWTIQAVECQRHGDSLLANWMSWRSGEAVQPSRNANLHAGTSEVENSSSRGIPAPRLRSFHNSVEAQAWCELRRSAPLCLMACLILPSIYFAFLCLNIHWELAPRAWMGALMAMPMIVQLLAVDCTAGITSHQKVVRFSPFDATRPMRCDQLIAIKVLVVFGWSLCGMALVALLAGLYALLSGEYGFWLQDFRAIRQAVGDVAPVWWVAMGMNLLLAFLGSTNLLYTYVLFLTRYPKSCAAAALIFTLHFGIFAWDASHDWPLLLLWKTYGFVVPLALISVSLLAIGVTIRAGYLSWWYFTTVLFFWLIYAISAVWLVSTATPPVPIPLWGYLFGVAFLLVPLASAAFAPLALATHRHA